MLDILLLGLNHKTAPVEIRECIAFSKDEMHTALDTLGKHPAVQEVVLISTCNRVEVLMTTGNDSEAVEFVKQFIAETLP